MAKQRRKLDWVAQAKKDFMAFPADVQYTMGFQLGLVQDGGMPDDFEKIEGIDGPAVYEMRERFDGNAYRCVYTAHLAHRVYVLHAFIKKSTRGRKTALHDIALIRRRLAAAMRADALLDDSAHGT